MSKRVLPKGLIMNQKQSNTGAPTIGGVGARTISNRRAILINAVHPISEIPYIPMIQNVKVVNQGVIIYLVKLQRNMTYEYQIEGTSNIVSTQANPIGKYITITGLTNSTNYTIKLRAVNIDNNKSDWVNITNIVPNPTTTSIINVGNNLVNIPAGSVVTYLIVGGGGGGGGSFDTGTGGGGGGGMVLTGTFTASKMTYTINVGAGGAGGAGGGGGAGETNGEDGGSSSISGIGVALGGGGGLSSRLGVPGQGGTKANLPATASTGGAGGGNSSNNTGSGGGGGSSGDGGSSVPPNAGAGGAGTAVTIGTISLTYGVGGAGRPNTSNGPGNNGANGTGNGGQGAASGSSDNDTGGQGGSGIVIISY